MERNQLKQKLSDSKTLLRKLLTVTKANNNRKSGELFSLLDKILFEDLHIERYLFIRKESGIWIKALSRQLKEEEIQKEYHKFLHQYDDFKVLNEADDEHLVDFDYIIPVFHKEEPLAYLLLSDVKEERTISPVVRNLNFLQTVTNVIVVAIENKRLFNEAILREREDQELELAGNIIQQLLPKAFPENAHFKASAFYESHMKVGGDYYDIVKTDDQSYTFLMADISGKGMAAALIMSNFQAYFKLAVEIGLGLSDLVHLLNQKVYENTRGEMFITAIFARYKTDTHELEYINTAHRSGILVQNESSLFLESQGRALGVEPNLRLNAQVVSVQKNARLILFTDGLTEVYNLEQEGFDEEKINELLRESGDVEIEKLNRRLIEKALDFAGRLGMEDDLALLSIEFL